MAPTKLNYKPMLIETLQDNTNIQNGKELSNLAKNLQAMINCTLEMEQFIKDKYLFSQEKIRDCLQTNTV